MNIDYSTIGERIRWLRISKGLSQEQVAELCDLSSGYISNIEMARKKASLKALLKLSKAMDVPLDEILVGNQSVKNTDYKNEISTLFEGCNQYERKLIINAAMAERESLKNNQALIQSCVIDDYFHKPK